MSQETLSALMDGECSAAELDAILTEFESSADTRERWSRMCLTRDALAGTSTKTANKDICSNVMAAILAEPMVAAEPQSSTVVQLPILRATRSRWQQPLIGLAAAASIAGAVVLGGNSLLSQQVDGTASTTAANDSDGPAATQRASIRTTDVASGEPIETRWGQLDNESARQLSDLMMEHSNYRAEQGMGGSLSYARMAVRTADYRPASEQH